MALDPYLARLLGLDTGEPGGFGDLPGSRLEGLALGGPEGDMGAPASPVASPDASEAFPMSRGDRILMALSGLSTEGLPQPRGFGAGLAQGLAGGLGAAGRKLEAHKAEFEKRAAERRAKLDEARGRLAEAEAVQRLKNEGSFREAQLKASTKEPTPYTIEGVPATREEFVRHQSRLATRKGEKPPAETPYMIGGVPATREEIVRQKIRASAGQGIAGKPPSAIEREQLTNDLTAIDQQNRIEGLFRPELVGPLSGRRGAVATATGEGLRRGESDFRAAVSQYRNAAFKAFSGATVSKQEEKRMRQQLPDENNPAPVFRAKLRQTKANLLNVARRRRKIYEGTGLDLSLLPPLPESDPTPTHRFNPATGQIEAIR